MRLGHVFAYRGAIGITRDGASGAYPLYCEWARSPQEAPNFDRRRARLTNFVAERVRNGRT